MRQVTSVPPGREHDGSRVVPGVEHSGIRKRKAGVTMTRRGGNKLVYQTEQALKAIEKIGTSKRDARKAGEKAIHSVTQIRKALSISQNFTKWARSQGVKDLYQLKRSHYRDYIQYVKDKGNSNGHIINVETNLRLLQHGMTEISKSRGHAARTWIPSKRLVSADERERPRNRSITVDQSTDVRAHLSTNAKDAQTLQEAFGLRLREAAKSTTHYIKERDGKLFWSASEAPGALNLAKGVTKAGRPRETPCEPSKEHLVRELLNRRSEGDYLVKIKYNSIRSAYNRADLSGSHSFRHTYAREMMNREIKLRGIDVNTARKTLEKYIEIKESGNNSKNMKQLKVTKEFQDLKVCMDTVHSYLGHGEGRMDLARVYIEGF